MSAIPSYPLNKRQFLESSKNRTALQLAIRSTVKNPSVIPRACIVVYQSYHESDFYLLCSSPCLYKYCTTEIKPCQDLILFFTQQFNSNRRSTLSCHCSKYLHHCYNNHSALNSKEQKPYSEDCYQNEIQN